MKETGGAIMPTLLHLGRRIINLDLVFEIEDYGDRLRLFYAVTSSDNAGVAQPAYSDVNGVDAENLRTWLAQHATYVAEPGSAPGTDSTATTSPSSTRIAQIQGNVTPRDEAAQTNDHPFYGAARIRQMHGVGGETDADAHDAGATEGSS